MKSFLEFYNQIKEDTLGKNDPIKLSQIDQKVAAAAVSSGHSDNDMKDDATWKNDNASVAANLLKPSQKEIILVKAFNMALNTQPFGGKFGVGGNLGSMISEDNYIVDGHHRWAATMLVDPNAKITATQIGLPGPALISALNIWTKSENLPGNKGTGEIKNFNGENIQKQIIDVAKQSGKSPDSPDGKAPGYTWEELQKRIAQFGQGDFEKGLNALKANADLVGKTTVESWCPERVEMPVIDEKKVKEVSDLIASGKIDIKPPFSQQTQTAISGKAPAAQTGIQGTQPPNAQAAMGNPNQQQLQAASMFYDDETLIEFKILSGLVISD